MSELKSAEQNIKALGSIESPLEVLKSVVDEEILNPSFWAKDLPDGKSKQKTSATKQSLSTVIIQNPKSTKPIPTTTPSLTPAKNPPVISSPIVKPRIRHEAGNNTKDSENKPSVSTITQKQRIEMIDTRDKPPNQSATAKQDEITVKKMKVNQDDFVAAAELMRQEKITQDINAVLQSDLSSNLQTLEPAFRAWMVNVLMTENIKNPPSFISSALNHLMNQVTLDRGSNQIVFSSDFKDFSATMSSTYKTTCQMASTLKQVWDDMQTLKTGIPLTESQFATLMSHIPIKQGIFVSVDTWKKLIESGIFSPPTMDLFLQTDIGEQRSKMMKGYLDTYRLKHPKEQK